MSFCNKCGEELLGGKFCPQCGNPISGRKSERKHNRPIKPKKRLLRVGLISIGIILVSVIIVFFINKTRFDFSDKPSALKNRILLHTPNETIFGFVGGSARIISNNTRLSDDDAIRQIATYLIFTERDAAVTPDMLTSAEYIYILGTMLVHSDAIVDERVSFDPPVITIDDKTANEYFNMLFNCDMPPVDSYFIVDSYSGEESECGWMDGKYYFTTNWGTIGKINYEDGEIKNITKNTDGIINADILFHPKDWMDTHVVMTLKPSNTAFRFQVLSFKTTTTDNSWSEEGDPVDASIQEPSAQMDSLVFPLAVPKRLSIAEQEELFHQAIALLNSDRLKATMMYDFSKRFSLHSQEGYLVTKDEIIADIYFSEPARVNWYHCIYGTYPVAVDRFRQIVLKNDGTASNISFDKQYFKDVIAVCSNQDVAVGLTDNGKVICKDIDTREIINGKSRYGGTLIWKDIVAIDAGDTQIVGLKSDGTVVSAGSEKEGQLNVDDWKDLVAVSAGQNFTCGLKADGTVVTTMPEEWVNDDLFRWNSGIPVANWDHIIAISAGDCQIVGLKDDGTVLYSCTEGFNDQLCDVLNWTDTIAVASGLGEVMALRSDGTLLVAGTMGFEDFYELQLW